MTLVCNRLGWLARFDIPAVANARLFPEMAVVLEEFFAQAE